MTPRKEKFIYVSEEKRMIKLESIHHLLHPCNVVIVGASQNPNAWSQRVYRNINKFNYGGKVFLVNPKYESINGVMCYPSLKELPCKPDHVLIFVPSNAVLDLLIQAYESGARSATVFSSGFGEDGSDEGKKRGEQLREFCLNTGLVVSGPNCLGNISAPAKLVTTTDQRLQEIDPGPVAIVGQSGGIVGALNRTLCERGIYASYMISSGNEICLTTADYIRYFISNDNIRVILSFIETIKNKDDFLSACEAAKKKGVIVITIKIGGSEASRKAALAHTGMMAGALSAFDSVIKHSGVIRVNTLDEMVELTDFFIHNKTPLGPKVGFVTFSGGLKGLLLESAERHQVPIEPLSDDSYQRLYKILGVGTSIGNPLDTGYTGLTNINSYLECIKILLEDPNIDMLFLQEEIVRSPDMPNKEQALLKVNELAKNADKPIAMFSMISHNTTEYSKNFRKRTPKLAYLQEIDKTVKVAKYVGDYVKNNIINLNYENINNKSINIEIINKIFENHIKQGNYILNEVDSKRILSILGLQLPKEKLVNNVQEAVQFAKEIGFPVVIKIVSSKVTHKSDLGLVQCDIQDEQELKDKYKFIVEHAHKELSINEISGILISQQINNGREVIIGVHNDPEVGPVMMFGSGGTEVEIYNDVSFSKIPLIDAYSLINETKISRILYGYRNGPIYDCEALNQALKGVSWIVEQFSDKILSIDINPLKVCVQGQGAYVLDSVIILKNQSERMLINE